MNKMENKNLIITAVILIVAVLVIFLIKPFSKININYINYVKHCKDDNECIKIKGDCCECNTGGTAIAINRKYSDYWNNKLNRQCKDIFCTQVISNDWTCFANVSCIENKCELIEEK